MQLVQANLKLTILQLINAGNFPFFFRNIPAKSLPFCNGSVVSYRLGYPKTA